MISKGHKANFDTLRRAMLNGDTALMECTDAKTGTPIIVVCAVTLHEGEYVFAPFAKMFDGDPYLEVLPPKVE